MFSTCGLRPACALFTVRQAGLRAAVGAAHVDAEHQVEALHRRGRRRREADRAGVVDQDVDAAEALHRLRHRGGHRVSSRMSRVQRQRLAAGGLDLLGRGVDGAGQLRVRLGGLGQQHDVGAVARRRAWRSPGRCRRLAPVMNRVLPLKGCSSSGLLGGDRRGRRVAATWAARASPQERYTGSPGWKPSAPWSSTVEVDGRAARATTSLRVAAQRASASSCARASAPSTRRSGSRQQRERWSGGSAANDDMRATPAREQPVGQRGAVRDGAPRRQHGRSRR